MILNMNMPTDWKELLEYWPIMRSLLGTTGSEGCRRRPPPPPRVRTVHGIMVKTWSCCCLEFNQCNLLVSDNQIYTPRIVAFLWHHGWVCSWGPRGDSRVDHVIVTGQWSRYIALPEISLIGPIPPEPPYPTLTSPHDPRLCRTLDGWFWNGGFGEKPKYVLVLSDAVYVFTGATVR